ncbi:uncharacterized protein LOC126795591 [Argentina anserina]|uniref:uncharacterized protein LOC126795591 n=1 Tax=Argentina anserina TaxID=57926 RepID=UPI0021768B56|nr:uncharacterized protein LOC126795591 [Potentilla anserina]
MTPFEALYGKPPPSVTRYLPGSTSIQEIDMALRTHDQLLSSLKQHLKLARNRMKQQADKKRRDKEFQKGEWVFLNLHPYRQQSLVKRPSHKLAPRFYGAAKVGAVAYKLHLPSCSKIHPVFHVSLLKKRLGDDTSASPTLPPFHDNGELLWTPKKVLDMAVQRKKKRFVTIWLIKWTGLPEEDASWEIAHSILAKFPTFSA